MFLATRVPRASLKSLNILSSAVGGNVPLEWVDRVVVACAASGGILRISSYVGTRINKNVVFIKFKSFMDFQLET